MAVTNVDLMNQLQSIEKFYEEKFTKLHKFVTGRCVYFEQENQILISEADKLKKQFSDMMLKYENISKELDVTKAEIVTLKSQRDSEEDSVRKCEEDLIINNTNTNAVNKTIDLQSAITNISDEVITVKTELNSLKQYNMDNDIVITGIPEVLKENLLELLNKMLVTYDVKLNKDDVKQIYRLKSKNCGVNSPVLLELKDKNMKLKILEKQRTIGPIMLQAVLEGLPSDDLRKIYFKHRLTRENLVLLKEARSFGRSFNYQYVWTNGSTSKVLMKKYCDSRVIEISSMKDIEKLKNY